VSSRILAAFNKRPRVLLIAPDVTEFAMWRRILDKAGCRVFAAAEFVRTREAAVHYGIEAVLCVTPEGDDDIAVAPLGVPVVRVGSARGSSDTCQAERDPTVILSRPADPRHVIALMHAAACGCFGVDVAPVGVGGEFAVVPALHLVFWRERLLRLPTAERLVFCALVLEPGRVFRWAELVAITGGAPVSGYIYLTRIRKTLKFCGAPTDSLETYRGKGVRWSGFEPNRGGARPGLAGGYHQES